MRMGIVLGISLVLYPVLAFASPYDSCDATLQFERKAGTKSQESAIDVITKGRKFLLDAKNSKKASAAQAKQIDALDAKLVTLRDKNDAIKKVLAKYIGGASDYAKEVKAAKGLDAMLAVCNKWTPKLQTTVNDANTNLNDAKAGNGDAQTLHHAVFGIH